MKTQEIIKNGMCALCERNDIAVTEHHLIPRTLHTNRRVRKYFTVSQMEQTIDLCRACHKTVHACYTEKELAQSFNTIEALRSAKFVLRFVEWIKKKPADLHIAVDWSNERRTKNV